MRMKSSMDFGRAIKMARTQRDWSQTDLAEYLGSSQRWVSEVENGKTRAELGKVLRCLRMLDITMEAEIGTLIGGKPLEKMGALEIIGLGLYAGNSESTILGGARSKKDSIK